MEGAMMSQHSPHVTKQEGRIMKNDFAIQGSYVAAILELAELRHACLAAAGFLAGVGATSRANVQATLKEALRPYLGRLEEEKDRG